MCEKQALVEKNKRNISKIESDVLLVSPYFSKVNEKNFFLGDLETHFRNVNKITVDLRIYNGEPRLKEYLSYKENSNLILKVMENQ